VNPGGADTNSFAPRRGFYARLRWVLQLLEAQRYAANL
jgi:hypothetical protein